MNEKQLIKLINDGKNLEVYIPNYTTSFMDSYYKYALLRLTMNYYTFYEVAQDNKNGIVEADEIVSLVNDTIKELLQSSLMGENYEYRVKDLNNARTAITNKMQILTAYIDRLQIYEYVLNRMELNFENELDVIDDQYFAKQLNQYIFGAKDNIIMNDRIREVIGQLPVRMSRNKYFDLIKDSLSVYQGGDKSSVEGYIYMLETCSMLYQPEGMETDFIRFNELINELDAVSYNQLTKAEHSKLMEKISKAAEEIQVITDWYYSLQELINVVYVLVLTNPYVMIQGDSEVKLCKEIINTIHKYFESNCIEPLPLELEEKLTQLEGAQEVIIDKINVYESVLFDIKNNYNELIDSLMLGTIFNNLLVIEKLLSSSLFVDIEDNNDTEIADAEFIMNITTEYISKISQMFQKNQMCINRAIIANTLEKMPVFFSSREEVMEYIIHSLEQCKDQAEKNVCFYILSEIMQKEQLYQKF